MWSSTENLQTTRLGREGAWAVVGSSDLAVTWQIWEGDRGQGGQHRKLWLSSEWDDWCLVFGGAKEIGGSLKTSGAGSDAPRPLSPTSADSLLVPAVGIKPLPAKPSPSFPDGWRAGLFSIPQRSTFLGPDTS